MPLMKLITLNIRQGGGKRTGQLLDYLIEKDADLIVLTEYRDNASGGLIRSELSRVGLTFFASPKSVENQNSVAIASKIPFEQYEFPSLSESDRHRVIGARLLGINIVGVYFPLGPAKQSLYDFFLENELGDFAAEAMIFGDFNTGLHFQDETKATFKLADRFAALPSKGFIDAWRTRNPERREFSWYSNAGNGFRLDHAFCSESVNTKIQEIEYDHSPRECKITDHSALIVEIRK